MNKMMTAGCILALLVLCVCRPALAESFDSIVIVSIDALHPDALSAETAPITWAMLKKGNLTRQGVSTKPPKTLVAHAAMITGVAPENGGRTSNVWSKGEPTIQERTIFHLAQD